MFRYLLFISFCLLCSSCVRSQSDQVEVNYRFESPGAESITIFDKAEGVDGKPMLRNKACGKTLFDTTLVWGVAWDCESGNQCFTQGPNISCTVKRPRGSTLRVNAMIGSSGWACGTADASPKIRVTADGKEVQTTKESWAQPDGSKNCWLVAKI